MLAGHRALSSGISTRRDSPCRHRSLCHHSLSSNSGLHPRGLDCEDRGLRIDARCRLSEMRKRGRIDRRCGFANRDYTPCISIVSVFGLVLHFSLFSLYVLGLQARRLYFNSSLEF